ncbi:hypothetical protein [Arthrobacter sp. zg-Y1110]|uniref:hypothetical protein n=1 Tax=Arthrobacter sp. zg-Y1110 TaxID=2886932 RepID=UPI001D149824|nr:hypothetical protein [Arthrobacter sp. zg-Y1110]MCC3292845.1 hypothetical protein [Arthrobacter sp. zg-Y1110]UWX86784.1 hypothetical protein N2K99_18245 [Arthrobacter sp. zg-Y1110]
MSISISNLPPFWLKTFGWFVTAAISIAHIRLVFSAHLPEAHFMWMYPLLLAIPAIVSIILLPGEARHWYRWGAVIGLSFSVYADALPLVLVIGGTYALHRAWVTERTLSLKDIFTFNRRPKSAEAPETKKTGSRSAGTSKAGKTASADA